MIYGLLVGSPFSDTFVPTEGGESLSISLDPDPHQSLSFTPVSTDFPALSDGMETSDNPGDDADSAGDNVGLIVAVMVGALLLTLAVVGVPLIVIAVIKMRKKCKQRTLDVPLTDGSSSS